MVGKCFGTVKVAQHVECVVLQQEFSEHNMCTQIISVDS